jgi:hypothetical protein
MPVLNDKKPGEVYNSSAPTVSEIMTCLDCGKCLRNAIDDVDTQIFEDYEILFWFGQSE